MCSVPPRTFQLQFQLVRAFSEEKVVRFFGNERWPAGAIDVGGCGRTREYNPVCARDWPLGSLQPRLGSEGRSSTALTLAAASARPLEMGSFYESVAHDLARSMARASMGNKTRVSVLSMSGLIFEWHGPRGWTPYAGAADAAIRSGVHAAPAGGTARLPGTLLEVRWGTKAAATARREAPPSNMAPPSHMVQLRRAGDDEATWSPVRRRRTCSFTVSPSHDGSDGTVVSAVTSLLAKDGSVALKLARVTVTDTESGDAVDDDARFAPGRVYEASVEIAWSPPPPPPREELRQTPLKALGDSRVSFTPGPRGPLLAISPAPRRAVRPALVVASFNMGNADVAPGELDAWLRRGAVGEQLAAVVLVGVQESPNLNALEQHLDGYFAGSHTRLQLGHHAAKRIGLGLLCYVQRGWVAEASPPAYCNLGAAQSDASAVFKGALGVRLRVTAPNSSDAAVQISACVAHLPAHQGQLAKRAQAVSTICRRLGAELFAGCDAAVFFGDLNFRLDPLLSRSDLRDVAAEYLDQHVAPQKLAAPQRTPSVRALQKNTSFRRATVPVAAAPGQAAFSALLETARRGDYGALLKFDELERLLEEVRAQQTAPPRDGVSLSVLDWNDAKCDFAPTFKMLRGDAASTYAPQRLPAYTDRVLYAGRLRLLQHRGVPQVTTSDHKPTIAAFVIT